MIVLVLRPILLYDMIYIESRDLIWGRATGVVLFNDTMHILKFPKNPGQRPELPYPTLMMQRRKYNLFMWPGVATKHSKIEIGHLACDSLVRQTISATKPRLPYK
jgi:hypothetical protein